MRKIILAAFLSVCLSGSIFSQTFLDSLNAKISTMQTTEKKVEFLNETSNYFRKMSDLDKAIQTSLLTLNIVKENELDTYLSKTLSFLGLCYRDKSEYFKAKDNFSQALEIAQN